MNRTKRAKSYVHPAALDWLTDATWNFAYRALWSGQDFSKTEIDLSKDFISEYYYSIPADIFQQKYLTYFNAYCERVMLAKKYVSLYPGRYIPHPCIWLNPRNAKGFSGTKEWYVQNRKRDGRLHCGTPAEHNKAGTAIHLHIHLSGEKEAGDGE